MFLYEAIWDVTVFCILGLLWAFHCTERFHGAVVAAYLCLYGIGRFAIEGLRIDDDDRRRALRINQVISVFAIATGLLVLAMLDRRRQSR